MLIKREREKLIEQEESAFQPCLLPEVLNAALFCVLVFSVTCIVYCPSSL